MSIVQTYDDMLRGSTVTTENNATTMGRVLVVNEEEIWICTEYAYGECRMEWDPRAEAKKIKKPKPVKKPGS